MLSKERMSQWVTSRKDRELWPAATRCARISLISFSLLTEMEKCYPHRSYVCSRKYNFGFIDVGCLRLMYRVSILTIGVQSTIHVSFSEGDQFNFTHRHPPQVSGATENCQRPQLWFNCSIFIGLTENTSVLCPTHKI